MCMEAADEDDIAYIEDNNLTLFCDEDCLTAGDEDFGGLWCNMRGLGQPCRACDTNE